MLKIRLMGPKEELEAFKGYALKAQQAYEINNISGMYPCKGTNRHLRMYAEIRKNCEKKESS